MEPESINNRRAFLKKLSMFSVLCLAGNNEGFANLSHINMPNGMIIKANEGEVFYIGNDRKAKVMIKVSKSPDYDPSISLLSEIITPGDGIPIHKHLNEEEFLFVQKGEVEVTLGDNKGIGQSGDFIYVPKKTWHGFLNTTNEDVVMLFGYAPAGFEDYFRKIGTKSIKQDLGFSADDWIRTNKKYGIVYKA